MLVSAGKTQRPSAQQFAAIKQELAPNFKARGLKLVSDLSNADLVATIELAPRPNMPELVDIILMDLGPNRYARASASPPVWVSPSMQEQNREQELAMKNSGGSVAGSTRW
jgi:hypothetical protein